jgi:hypothetical protein
VSAVPFAVAETVFVPATVELNVPLATPFASVGPAGWVRVFPLPVAASTTVAPLIGLPFTSFAVTVIVEDPLPAEIEIGAAVTVDCDASTPDALISTPSAPPFRPIQLASIVLSVGFHSAWRSEPGLSPEGCSLISVKPVPGVTASTWLRTPKTP